MKKRIATRIVVALAGVALLAGPVGLGTVSAAAAGSPTQNAVPPNADPTTSVIQGISTVLLDTGWQ